MYLTCSWRFLRSKKSEKLYYFKLEKIIGIKKVAGKVRKYIHYCQDLKGSKWTQKNQTFKEKMAVMPHCQIGNKYDSRLPVEFSVWHDKSTSIGN